MTESKLVPICVECEKGLPAGTEVKTIARLTECARCGEVEICGLVAGDPAPRWTHELEEQGRNAERPDACRWKP